MQEFKIKVGEFEGPLDLLLELIEKRKLHINDVSLSQVTDDYIAHVKTLQEFSIPGISHFVLTASTLLLIKSRSLLPGLLLSDEEEADIKDLEERLRIYKRIKELSGHIKARFGKNMIFERGESREIVSVFSPPQKLSLSSILGSIRAAIESIPVKEMLPEAIVKKIVSIEEMISRLSERVQSSLKVSFKEFSKNSSEKVEVIVSFLAMLELVKQGAIGVVQDKQFEDIHMEAGTVGVPKY